VKLRSLQELGALKLRLAQHRRDALQQQARQREQARRQQRASALFSSLVGEVVPLKPSGLADVARPRPAPWPRQRELDERAALRETLSDEIDVESLLDTDDTLSFRRPDLGPEVVRKLRRGHWAIQRQIDLHGLRRDEAREQLALFLHDAERAGLRCVRVVHGKGNGSPGREPVLKNKVRGWLVQRNEVLAFVQARASEGGHGALIVLMRPHAGKREN
jgi:DNA-nicking Smr family endonuclease